MSDPRTPRTQEAQLPDALDQVPDAHPPAQGLFGEHGTEDAALMSEVQQGEGDAGQDASGEDPGAAAP